MYSSLVHVICLEVVVQMYFSDTVFILIIAPSLITPLRLFMGKRVRNATQNAFMV